MRETPDISFDADPNTGVPIDDSYDFGSGTPWAQYGGTSLSAPCIASLLAISDQFRTAEGLSLLDGPEDLYSLPATDFNDITSGSNGNPAGPGYDMATGLGTPIANLLVPALGEIERRQPGSGAGHAGVAGRRRLGRRGDLLPPPPPHVRTDAQGATGFPSALR